ncbi:SDR family oxidoreductase [Algiphilus sp.]|uniref:SDR family NAD(P)-dependent oxidoreductase n=1 Tax=Algiphilus sp. TaxID=1872431 RepID=UPI0025C4D596|nr:SDR family oxidoreductase [Algiphilus sp.]MCK5771189.1 SDR family oxidoreductase [Algiphilus sp.]
MTRLADKVAVITGASSGIGRACMVRFAREGARVVGCSRTQSRLDEALAEVTAAGGTGMAVAADVGTEDGAARLIEAAIAAYGRIDILVNAAGVGYSLSATNPGAMGDIVEARPEQWREVMGIDLDSCYLTSRLAVPHMRTQGGGAIVHVSSILGLTGHPDAHAYTSAKGALINLTRSMCAAYTKDGIRTNCVAPGFIDTPMIASHISAFEDEAVADRLCPMHRAGTPEEVANGCLFLVSDEASYCNGTTLVLDGGSMARL